MQRRLIINAILILVVIGAGLALWLTRQPPPVAPTTTAVLATPANAVRRIAVRHDSSQVVLQRPDSHHPWQMVQPAQAAPDPSHIAWLLMLASARTQRHYPLDSIPDTTTGLGSSAVVVTYNDNAPVRLGNAGPTPGSRYVATPHALLLVDLPELGALDEGWTYWIDPALIAADARLKRLVLPEFTLSLGDNNQWQASPVGQRSNAAAQTTIDTWQRAKALAVVPADHRRERIARITLAFAHAPTRQLDVIERIPNLVLRDPRLDVDYHLAGNRVAPLLDLVHPGLAPLKQKSAANEREERK